MLYYIVLNHKKNQPVNRYAIKFHRLHACIEFDYVIRRHTVTKYSKHILLKIIYPCFVLNQYLLFFINDNIIV